MSDVLYIDLANLVIRHLGHIIEYIGLGIVVGSVAVSIWKVLQHQYTMGDVRHQLARRIIFGLEFVIAADILLATVAANFDEIIKLGGIVLIRVVLDYSLRKEAQAT